jgi:hypothetical protein
MTERILVVEDEANIASFVSAYLEKAGYAVDRAVNGTEAKEKAVSADPAKLKTFCDMSKVMNAMGEKQDAAAEAKIDDEPQQFVGPFHAFSLDYCCDAEIYFRKIIDRDAGRQWRSAIGSVVGCVAVACASKDTAAAACPRSWWPNRANEGTALMTSDARRS